MSDVHHDDPASAQVLTNPDLLHCIFVFVHLSPQSARDRNITRCAVVCRAFHEPAIRVLWRNLGSLLPLWHLLAPSDTPFPYSSGGDGDALSYLQKINSAQLYLDPIRWDRFLRHAAHVRGIIHNSSTSQTKLFHDANSLLIQSAIVQNGGDTLLPLLRTIEWRGRTSGDDTLIPFFTSTLRHTAISLKGPDEAAHLPLLRKLRESSPLLEKIILIGNGRLLTIQELVCFPRLQQITLTQISGPDAFRALVMMPNLTRLTVFDVAGLQWAAVGDTISVRSGLQELYVGGDASAVYGLFHLVRFQALKSATICRRPSPGTPVAPAGLTAFLSLFYNAVSTSGLHSLRLKEYSKVFPSSRYERPALRDLVAPILPIRDLRTFSLRALDTITTVDDTDVEALAIAWPDMEHFFIDRGPSTSESSVSLNALHYLHRHCSHLRELSIPRLRWPIIGAHSIPGPLNGSPSHPLRRLIVQNAYLSETVTLESLGPDLSDEDAEAMARYLLDLFPRLEPEQYKQAAQEDLSLSFGFRERGKPQSILRFDGRWWKVTGHIYTICAARDGL